MAKKKEDPRTAKEIQHEKALVLLAKAIETGRIEGLQKEIKSILHD